MAAQKGTGRSSSLYSVHPVVRHSQSIVKNLPTKTGRSLEQWVDIIRVAGVRTDRERMAWLKQEFGLGGATARLVLEQADGRGAENLNEDTYLRAAEQYVDEMYSGAKQHLRPIHDRLIELGTALGPDVKISPCKTIVPFYRQHVFAEIKPATQKRVDFGLALKGANGEFPKRLLPTGGLEKGDRITHRFAITSLFEIDEEVKAWFEAAFSLDG